MRASSAVRFVGRTNLRKRSRRPNCRPCWTAHEWAIRHDTSASGRGYLSTQQHPELYLYNSMSKAIEPLQTHQTTFSDDGTLSSPPPPGLACYTCGPTVYAPAHLGHARTYVCLDIFRRVVEAQHDWHSGIPPPLFVMNITDVDDKILQASSSSSAHPAAPDDDDDDDGSSWTDPVTWARHYENAFWRDWDTLHCRRPHVVTRVTEHVSSHIVPYIARLLHQGLAYATENDGVYFDVPAFEHKMQHVTRYGKLAPSEAAHDFYRRWENNDDESSDSGSSTIRSTKRDARDFVLWKLRDHDPASVSWESPWGVGRPGWHIECSAMIEAVQQQFVSHRFMLHAGGVDLQFPHHTNEIAQAEGYHLSPNWISHWMHVGHLHIDGRKMSKSLKNFITIQELFHGHDAPFHADDFRWWCLSKPYRNAVTFSTAQLQQAQQARQQVVQFLLDADESVRCHVETPTTTTTMRRRQWAQRDVELWQAAVAHVVAARAALWHDLDGPTYLDELGKLVQLGTQHLQHDNDGGGAPPPEAIMAVVAMLRDLLRLPGFSRATAGGGNDDAVVAITAAADDNSRSRIVGGERALLDELVRFRAHVRQVVWRGDGNVATLSAEIMRLCDDAREHVFPAMGIALVDGQVDDSSQHDDGSSWKYRVPRKTAVVDSSAAHREEGDSSPPPPPPLPTYDELVNISVDDYFHAGQYAHQFGDFDRDGVPTSYADGSAVSNRERQKLRKKRDKHAKRLTSREIRKGI